MSHVGVDLSATAVRVVELSGVNKDGLAVISRAAVRPLAPGAIVAGEIKKPVVVANALREALKDGKFPTKSIVLGHTSQRAEIAYIAVPSTIKGREITAYLRANTTLLDITQSLDESVLSINPAGETADGKQLLSVAVVPTDTIDPIRELCRVAKITPRAIDLSAAALTRSMSRTTVNGREVVTTVDCGATQTTVATRVGSHLRSLRTVPVGSDDITRAMMSATGSTLEEAETNKRWMRLSNGKQTSSSFQGFDVSGSTYADLDLEDEEDPKTKREQALEDAASHLLDQIVASVEDDRDQHGTLTQGVILAGGGAMLRGLKDRLVSRLGVDCMVGRPWVHIDDKKRTRELFTDDPVSGRRPDPEQLLTLAVATGLAQWEDHT